MNSSLVSWTAATELAEMAAMSQLRAGNTTMGCTLYAGTGYLFQRAMEGDGEGLAVSNGLWNAFSNVAGAFLGMYGFGETISTKKLLGLGLGADRARGAAGGVGLGAGPQGEAAEDEDGGAQGGGGAEQAGRPARVGVHAPYAPTLR